MVFWGGPLARVSHSPVNYVSGGLVFKDKNLCIVTVQNRNLSCCTITGCPSNPNHGMFLSGVNKLLFLIIRGFICLFGKKKRNSECHFSSLLRIVNKGSMSPV
jgi:hypothetical protein